jgi:hypothetical protein
MLYHHVLDKICDRGSKLLNFKIGKSILQNDENRRDETAIKLNKKNSHNIIGKVHHISCSVFQH